MNNLISFKIDNEELKKIEEKREEIQEIWAQGYNKNEKKI